MKSSPVTPPLPPPDTPAREEPTVKRYAYIKGPDLPSGVPFYLFTDPGNVFLPPKEARRG